MSPKRSRRSSSALGYLVLVLVAVLVWYQGNIPGLPKPDEVLPKLKQYSTYVPDIKELGTVVPDIPGVGTLFPSSSSIPETPVPLSSGGDLPASSEKPEPKEITFRGCPPPGDGGDPELNLLKNRVDEGNYQPASFDSIMALSWPRDVERRDRENWSDEDRNAIAKYEGIPLIVEGYIVLARESGPESTNCHATESELVDWHVWFTKNPNDDRAKSIIIETTPRVRVNHRWTISLVDSVIIESQARVRISGWLFFDPEHPDQIGKTRGTLWEIHPVMQIEAYQDGQWIPLDNFAQ